MTKRLLRPALDDGALDDGKGAAGAEAADLAVAAVTGGPPPPEQALASSAHSDANSEVRAGRRIILHSRFGFLFLSWGILGVRAAPLCRTKVASAVRFRRSHL